MSNFYLKPVRDAAGKSMLVRDPSSGKPLDPKGEWKPRNQFWTRRVLQRDAIEAEPESVAQAPSSPSPA
jgi:hypothetical protein